YADMRGREGRRNFGGVHVANQQHATTNLTLMTPGYDSERNRLLDLSGALSLVDPDGAPAASWSYAGLMAHWKRKHAKAVYVPSSKRRLLLADPEYCYGGEVALGVGTDFLLLLKAISQGAVYYDPGIKVVETNGRRTSKRRSQFRIRSRQLDALYFQFNPIRVA